MDPSILLMLTVERRFETRLQEYWLRRDRSGSVKRTSRPGQNDLVKRILSLVRRQPSCECC